MLYYCNPIRLSVQLYSVKRVEKGHAKVTDGTRALPRGHVSAPPQLMRAGRLYLCGGFFICAVIKHKLAANAGQTQVNWHLQTPHARAFTPNQPPWTVGKAFYYLQMQVKSGDYIILHCDSKHNVKDYSVHHRIITRMGTGHVILQELLFKDP